MTGADGEREELAALVRELGVVHGRVTLASGREADYYVDLRRVTLLHAVAAERATDPATPPVDAFVVRKSTKEHGLQRLIEGPDVTGRPVLVVEDTSTTGGSPLKAAETLEKAGAEIVAVAVVVDRNTGAKEVIEAAGYPYLAAMRLTDLGLA